MKDLVQTEIGLLFLVLLFVLEIFKENSKKNSENEHLTGYFQSFFFRPIPPPPTLNLKNVSRESTYKKNLA